MVFIDEKKIIKSNLISAIANKNNITLNNLCCIQCRDSYSAKVVGEPHTAAVAEVGMLRASSNPIAPIHIQEWALA